MDLGPQRIERLITDRVELFISGGDRFNGNADSWFAKFGVRFQTWKLF